jgi:hypothetical protein
MPMLNNLRSSMLTTDGEGKGGRVIPLPHPQARAITLLDVFDRIAVINPDAAGEELAVRGLRALSLTRIPGLVDFIPEVPLRRPNGWASPTAGTVFMTHYSVLKQALDRRWNSVLVWDARADFASSFAPHQSQVVYALASTPWDVFLLSYEAGKSSITRPVPERQQSRPQGLMKIEYRAVRGVSAYAISRTLLPHLVKAMGEVLENPTRLATPFTPTAATFEPEAVSLVLRMVLRSRPELLTFAPEFASTPCTGQEDVPPAPSSRSNLVELIRTKSAGK